MDEEEIESDIDRETDGEYLDTFLYPSDTGEYLEVNLEEEITHDKDCRVLEDNPRHMEFVSEEDGCDLRSEYEHKHARDDTQNREIFVKKGLDGTDLVFVSFGVELGDDREEESDNRRDDDERYPDDTQVIRIVSGIAGSEEVDDELHIDLSEDGPDIGCEHHPEGVFYHLSDEIGIVDSLRIPQVWDVVWSIHEVWSDDNPSYDTIDPCPRVADEIPIVSQPETSGEKDDEGHSEEFHSFLEAGILTHPKYGDIDIMEIESEEKQTENLDNSSRFSGMEIVLCEPSGWEE